MENDPHSPLHISVPASVWTQIDILAAQIENPSTAYLFDTTAMTQAVVRDQMARAQMIRKLVPEAARNSY